MEPWHDSSDKEVAALLAGFVAVLANAKHACSEICFGPVRIFVPQC